MRSRSRFCSLCFDQLNSLAHVWFDRSHARITCTCGIADLASPFRLTALTCVCLSLVQDIETPQDEELTEEQQELVESAAEILYGLIHARYILTQRGMLQMVLETLNLQISQFPRPSCLDRHAPRLCLCPMSKCETMYAQKYTQFRTRVERC